MKKILILSAVLFFGYLSFAHASNKVDPSITPGKLCSKSDKDYKKTYEDNGKSIIICNRNVRMNTKYSVLHRYGISKSKRNQYKIDHFIPLNIGGSNHISNLFPISKDKMGVYERPEWPIYQAYRKSPLTQKQAVEFVKNWKTNSWNKDWVYSNEHDLIIYEEEYPNPYN